MRISLELDSLKELVKPDNSPSTSEQFHITNTKPWLYLNCVGVLSPPISYTPPLTADPSGRVYYIKIMICAQGSGPPYYYIPYVNFTGMNLAVPPASVGAQWQFQMLGVLPGALDPADVEFYQTMTVSQPGPGSLIFRHRLFVPPSKTPVGGVNEIDQGSINVICNVQVNGADQEVSFPVDYVHCSISDPRIDPGGPRDLYLQQPY